MKNILVVLSLVMIFSACKKSSNTGSIDAFNSDVLSVADEQVLENTPNNYTITDATILLPNGMTVLSFLLAHNDTGFLNQHHKTTATIYDNLSADDARNIIISRISHMARFLADTTQFIRPVEGDNKPAQHGLAYLYGGKDPTSRQPPIPPRKCNYQIYGLDNSGFIYQLFLAAGIRIPPGTVNEQIKTNVIGNAIVSAIPSLSNAIREVDTFVTPDEFQSGDIIYWQWTDTSKQIGVIISDSVDKSINIALCNGLPDPLQPDCITNLNLTSVKCGPRIIKPSDFKWFDNGNYRIIRILTVDSANLPVVTTASVAGITKNSASSGGNVISNGGSIIAKGICWSSVSSMPVLQNNDGYTNDGTGGGQFTSVAGPLSASTTYYLRAYATNANGTSYGNVATFSTSDALYATVTTTAATLVTLTSAESGGNVTDDGGSMVTARGVCYATHTNPTVSDKTASPVGSGTGSYTCNITGLLPGVTYYAKAYAINNSGKNTSYGNEQVFTTTAAPNPLDKTSWLGMYHCPTWGPGTWPANKVPGYTTPENYLPVIINFTVANDTELVADFLWLLSGVHQGVAGYTNGDATKIIWTDSYYILPETWTVSGNIMTGELSTTTGCQHVAFSLSKQ
jgi:NlpC/P60 family protein